MVNASRAFNPQNLRRKYYYPHFTDEKTDSENQMIKLRVTANKKLKQVLNLGLSRNLELVIINTKLSKVC